MQLKNYKIEKGLVSNVIFLLLYIFIVYLILINIVTLCKDFNISKIIASLEEKVSRSKSAEGYGMPYHLVIPSLGLVSHIEQVGTTSTGMMDTPKNIKNVAWYRYGSRPGEVGSAVIVGHYGWRDNEASAFDRLSEIKIGNKIYIEDDRGTHIVFIVRKIKKYDQDAITNDIFSSSDGLAHVNLITCTGIWNRKDNDYASRLIVFTDKESR